MSCVARCTAARDASIRDHGIASQADAPGEATRSSHSSPSRTSRMPDRPYGLVDLFFHKIEQYRQGGLIVLLGDQSGVTIRDHGDQSPVQPHSPDHVDEQDPRSAVIVAGDEGNQVIADLRSRSALSS